MKNKSFFASVKCAFNGVVAGFKSERNFKIYIIMVLIFLILNIILSSTMYDYIILLATACCSFSAEYINTSIERLVDVSGDEITEDFKFIKDVAAGAVLVSGVAFFGSQAIILISKLVG